MKQHITKEQVNEKDIDWDYWLAKLKMFDESKIKLGVTDVEISKQLTIGKMIEMLGEKVCEIELDHNVYYVYVAHNNVFAWRKEFNGNLCDALWEAVKYVLEQEDKQ